ncbi:hypothetical protein [Streptomyces sp. Tu 3180]|uniref:hypothetical protein n=1 Tax=Streptomyces sp. Tu 3180 TaxID=2682611 RepID=UPI001FB74CCE|nr:hypothetical protein [Streptomyces sp. Tu 3180]
MNRSSYYKWLAGRPELPSSTGTGSWRSATIMTLAQGGILMKRWAASGEAFADRYFRCSDGLIARAAGINNMPQVLTGLIQNGEFTRILQRLDD